MTSKVPKGMRVAVVSVVGAQMTPATSTPKKVYSRERLRRTCCRERGRFLTAFAPLLSVSSEGERRRRKRGAVVLVAPSLRRSVA